MVTCPSAISTTLLSLRTHSTVVPCHCALPGPVCIRPLYSRASPRQAHPLLCRSHGSARLPNSFKSDVAGFLVSAQFPTVSIIYWLGHWLGAAGSPGGF